MSEHIYDLTVIGGGPVGLFATFYAGLRSADVLLVESLSELGGQPGNLYPAKVLYDIGGLPGVSGEGLVEQLKSQVTHFHPTIQTATAVLGIQQTADGFKLITSADPIATKAVIIATGGGAFTPRKLAVDYDPALDGQKVMYTVRHLEDFAGQDVAIAGGGDSAIDWALALAPVANSVHLIHRRNQFRGLESSVQQLQSSLVVLHTPFLIDTVVQEANRLAVQLQEVRGEQTQHLAVDKLLVNYGFTSDNKLLQSFGVALDHNAVTVDSEMASSVPGIYAIGDAATYPGKVKLIASGFGEAPTAINAALARLYPERRQALHSTQLYH